MKYVENILVIQDVIIQNSLQIKKVCSICNEGIYDGEEYIVNGDYEYAHWECVNYARDLAKFLGYEIKEMSKDY